MAVGVTLRLGDTEPLREGESWISGVGDAVATGMADLAMLQFTSMYWSFFGMGGFVITDTGYDVGDGTRWRTSMYDDDGETVEVILERALLREDADGTRLWRVVFEVERTRYEYETLVGPDLGLLELTYRDESGTISTYTPSDPEAWWGQVDLESAEVSDLLEKSTGTERVTVPAGTFRTAAKVEVRDEEQEALWQWWVADDVPGQLVKFSGSVEGQAVVSGELIEVLSNVTSPW